MIARVVEWITGRDDVERIARRGSLHQLEAYLETRPLWFPRRPSRFLDASEFGPEELLAMIREDAESLADDPFIPWVLGEDEAPSLPAFSSLKRMTTFSGVISQRLGKVFSLGSAQVLTRDVVRATGVSLVDLNPLCAETWQIRFGPAFGGDGSSPAGEPPRERQ